MKDKQKDRRKTERPEKDRKTRERQKDRKTKERQKDKRNFKTRIATNNRDISLSLEKFHFFQHYHIDDISSKQ